MRRYARVLAAALLMAAILCGCDSWSGGSYFWEEPYVEQNAQPEQENLEAGTYQELHNALTELVENVSAEGIISVSELPQEKTAEYMDAAIRSVMYNNAVGAYAVEEISYEIGTNAGKAAIAVDITYSHSRAEIMRIEQVKNVDEAKELITDALASCNASVIFRIAQYYSTDFIQFVQDYADNYPEICMEVPQVSVVTYPESGRERIVELAFTYQNSREVLRSMKLTVQIIAAQLKLGSSMEKSVPSQVYTFLMERHDYKVETSITPAYSLLHHGVGDSKAFAYVYAALCRRVGQDCEVISGTKNGEPWFWNAFEEDGVYYHVDLLECRQLNGFEMVLGSQMNGYVWDYTNYPVDTPPEETTAPTQPEETAVPTEKTTLSTEPTDVQQQSREETPPETSLPMGTETAQGL